MRTIEDIAQDMATQDNDCTAEPLFVVQRRKRIYGLSSSYANDCVWVSQDGEHTEADAATTAKLDAKHEETCHDSFTLLDPESECETEWERVWYCDEWEFVTCCFTRNGAETFIAKNHHRYDSELRIWTDSLHRNREMIDVRAHLLAMVKP